MRSAAERDRFDLGPPHYFLAEEVARWPAGLDDEERRALALLVLATLVAREEGSTRLPVRGRFLDEVLDGLGEPGARAAIERLLDPGSPARQVIGEPGEFKPLLLAGEHLYHQRLLALEERLAAAVRARWRGGGGAPARIDASLGDGLVLSDEQRVAVEAALAGRLTVITGGPGTGKTTIVLAILRALVASGVRAGEIALAAPTGKAANRMRDAIGARVEGLPAPRTLHRLLGYSPSSGRFRHHPGNPLAERVVIVDEGSMIDLHLMERLLSAVRDEARLVLIGDAEQLPSVEAGAVFRDLAQHRAVRLTRSFRMDESRPEGRNLHQVASLVNEGRADALFPPWRETLPLFGGEHVTPTARAASLRFRKVELLDLAMEPGSREWERFLDRWLDERVRALPEFDTLAGGSYRHDDRGFSVADEAALRRLLAHWEGFRILCVTRGRGRRTGAEAVNLHLHDRLRPAGSALPFAPGEPVLMQENDYERGLFNGDQGVVVRIVERGGAPRPMAVFPTATRLAVFPLESLRGRLALAHAMTVHKAQGSEFDHAALILPDEDLPLSTREVLYTAITRARNAVTIVGRRDLLVLAVNRRIERFSGIAERLSHEA